MTDYLARVVCFVLAPLGALAFALYGILRPGGASAVLAAYAAFVCAPVMLIVVIVAALMRRGWGKWSTWSLLMTGALVAAGIGANRSADAFPTRCLARVGPNADLSGCVFESPMLQGRDLSGAKLTGARFQSADLRGAILTGAQMDRAQVSGDLTGADLSGARLAKAYLTGARLQHTNLSRADLRGARLRGADLTDAILEGALLDGADLVGVVGLSGPMLGSAGSRQGIVTETAEERQRLLQAACEGQAMPGAVPYLPDAAIHLLLMRVTDELGQVQSGYYGQIPWVRPTPQPTEAAWDAGSTRAADLTLCIREVWETVEYCSYNLPGAPISQHTSTERIQHRVEARLFETATGALVDERTFHGSPPSPCPFAKGGNTLHGSPVTWGSIAAWLEPVLGPHR